MRQKAGIGPILKKFALEAAEIVDNPPFEIKKRKVKTGYTTWTYRRHA